MDNFYFIISALLQFGTGFFVAFTVVKLKQMEKQIEILNNKIEKVLME